jgi:hypothetical protein
MLPVIARFSLKFTAAFPSIVKFPFVLPVDPILKFTCAAALIEKLFVVSGNPKFKVAACDTVNVPVDHAA